MFFHCFLITNNIPMQYRKDKIEISIVFSGGKRPKKVILCSTVRFSVEIERPWESFISKISSLTLCSMTISSYVLFISPPIYIEGRLRQGCSRARFTYVSPFQKVAIHLVLGSCVVLVLSKIRMNQIRGSKNISNIKRMSEGIPSLL